MRLSRRTSYRVSSVQEASFWIHHTQCYCNDAVLHLLKNFKFAVSQFPKTRQQKAVGSKPGNLGGRVTPHLSWESTISLQVFVMYSMGVSWAEVREVRSDHLADATRIILVVLCVVCGCNWQWATYINPKRRSLELLKQNSRHVETCRDWNRLSVTSLEPWRKCMRIFCNGNSVLTLISGISFFQYM
jgi:hypothetical protein